MKSKGLHSAKKERAKRKKKVLRSCGKYLGKEGQLTKKEGRSKAARGRENVEV